jgi:hypothetical protein
MLPRKTQGRRVCKNAKAEDPTIPRPMPNIYFFSFLPPLPRRQGGLVRAAPVAAREGPTGSGREAQVVPPRALELPAARELERIVLRVFDRERAGRADGARPGTIPLTSKRRRARPSLRLDDSVPV